MIYIKNNLEEQSVFIPRNDTTFCYVSPYDKGYHDGYQDGVDAAEDCDIQTKEVVLTAVTETIAPDDGYVGMGEVEIDARELALEKYNEGYHEGEDAGVEEQKRKLLSTAFTENGIYKREDGWDEVEVDVTPPPCPELGSDLVGLNAGWNGDTTFYPSAIHKDGFSQFRVYDNGYGNRRYENGRGAQKALLTSTAFTENGLYRKEDGWNEVTVEVPLETKTETVTAATQTILPSSGYEGMSEVVVDATDYGQGKYDEGFLSGQTDILSGMSSTAFTINGVYTNPSGWSGVTVEVPQTGSSCTLQNKQIGIGSGFTGTTVLPDSGYDGMTSVEIYDDGYGQEKYDEGYQDALGDCPSPTLEQKSVVMSATNQTFYPSSGYDGMDEIAVDATSIYDKGYNDGYNTGEQSFGIEIIPDSSVTITEYGTYYFVYDSATSVSAMTVYFGTTPQMPTQFKVQLYNIRENINGPLYNLSASTASLVRIEIDDVVFTGTTYTGRPTRIDYYFNDYIPEAFFSGLTIAADVIVLGLTNTGNTITVNRNAFTDSTLSAIAFQKGNYLIKENGIYNTVMGAVTFWKSNITVETNGITHNTNLHFIQFGQNVSFTADGTAFYESTTVYPNDRRVGIVSPITIQYIRQQAWYINNLEPDGWRIVDYT